MFRMHRLAGLAVLLATGCLREKVQYCNNGAYCPEPLICTERTDAPFCGDPGEVEECLGQPEEAACTLPGAVKGFCETGICRPCDPNFSFCRYETWTAMTPVTAQGPVTAQLNDVWVAGPNELYIAGQAGTFIRWDGRAWSALSSIATDAETSSIWGFGSNAIYATTVGQVSPNTRVFRFDGTAWTAQALVASQILNEVWGASGQLFVVGVGGYVGHYDGSTWSSSMPTGAVLNGVWGTDADHAIAVGANATTIRYTSGTWSPDPSGTTHIFQDVGGVGTSEFVVGRISGATRLPAVVRHEGNTWTDMTAMLPDVGLVELRSVWVVAPNDVYAVGEGGTIVHYDGSAWTTMNSGVVVALNEIHGTSTDLFVVGAGGTVLRLSR